MVPPAATGVGVPLLVTARSQSTETVVATVVLLLAVFGSLVEEVIVEVAVIVPAATVAATFTPMIMSADAPEARLVSVQFTLPVAPTAGYVHAQPGGTDTEAKVVFAGMASWKITAEAAAGPLFVTVCV